VRLNAVHPPSICHILPIVFIKTGSMAQRLASQVEQGATVIGVKFDRFPRDGEALVADTEKAAQREDRVWHLIRARVDYNVLNLAGLLVLT
jgi:hypothetical protein